MLKFKNAGSALTIPTHEGSGQCTHPCVIDFKVEHGKDTWGGYRYWMVMTPYPASNDAHEDPNIVASNDKVKWIVPNGISNPLEDAPGGGSTETGSFHSDPDMVYNPDTNELWVYFRLNVYTTNPYLLYLKLVKISENGTCSAPQIIYTEQPFGTYTHKWRSFCIWRESSTKWHMWGQGGSRPFGIYYRFSTDGITWGDTFTKCNDPVYPLGYEPWHMGCKPDFKDGKVKFLLSSIIKDDANISNPVALIYAECAMDNPTLLSCPIATPVLSKRTSGWDNELMYRPSFIIHPNGAWELFYGAKNSTNVWGIGYSVYSETRWMESKFNAVKNNGVIARVSETKVKTVDGWQKIDKIYVKG